MQSVIQYVKSSSFTLWLETLFLTYCLKLLLFRGKHTKHTFIFTGCHARSNHPLRSLTLLITDQKNDLANIFPQSKVGYWKQAIRYTGKYG